MTGLRRIGGPGLVALDIFLVLVVLALAAPEPFVFIAVVAFVVAPSITWRAWYELRTTLRQDPKNQDIESLKKDVRSRYYSAIGSTGSMILGLFVAARALDLVPMVPREVFLVGLTFQPILAVVPAIDTLLLVRRMAREDALAAAA